MEHVYKCIVSNSMLNGGEIVLASSALKCIDICDATKQSNERDEPLLFPA